jgi:tripartite-type tricarboxylate transporter receptor subunit TctC
MAISCRSKTQVAVLATITIATWSLSATAQTTDDFYKGKTIHIIVGAEVGAAYDFAGRAVGAHLGRFVPGNPTVVVENMPGAASITAMNHLYNRAARDGTVIVLPLNGVVLEPRLNTLSRDGSNVKFDLSKISWIGSPAQQPQSIMVWHASTYQSLQDLREKPAIFGTTSPGTDSNVMPMLLNNLAGTKIKVISGYKGVNDVFHAIEQGELQGASILLSSFLGKSDWVEQSKGRILLHFGLERIKSLPDIPTAIELMNNEQGKCCAFMARNSRRPTRSPCHRTSRSIGS